MRGRIPRRAAVVLGLTGLVFGAGAVLAAATPDPIIASVPEDATNASIVLTAASDNPAATTATVAISNGPSHGTVQEGSSTSMTCTAGSCQATVHYSPAADYNGPDAFDYTVDDGDGASSPATVSITVDPVNDAPSFTAGGDVTVDEDSGGYSASWAAGVAGPANESGQELSFELTSDDNPALFAVAPAVAPDGTLSFTPAANANGSATVGFTLHDDGGTLNGGIDSSAEQTFTITVDPVNDAPTFSGAGAVTVNEDSGGYTASWASSIVAGPSDEDAQSVSFLAIADNDNSGLFAVGPAVASDGTLTFTPAANANGVAHMSVTAQDDGGIAGAGADTSEPASLTITVTAVNDAPTFDDAGDVTVLEDSGAYNSTWVSNPSTGPSDESGQTLAYSIQSNDNPGLFSSGPVVGVDGKLAFTPAADANGSATVGIEATDGGGVAHGGDDTSTVHTMTITVTPVNDPPSFTPGSNPVVHWNAGAVSLPGWVTAPDPGPADESGQTLAYAFVANDHASLFSVQPAVSAAGDLTFTTAPNQSGTAVLTLRAQDSGGVANGGIDWTAAQVSIRVNAKPDAVNDTTFVVAENAHAQSLNVLANDSSSPDAAETLVITGTTSPLHGTVAITGSASALSVTGGTAISYTPTPGYYGDNADFFTYTISDGLDTDTATVILSIAKDTMPPTVTTPLQHIRAVSSGSPIVTMTSTTLVGYVTWSGSDAGVGISSYQVQRSISGGTYASLTLASPTSTALNVSYTFGKTYRFRVRAIDRNGNVGAWIYGPTFAVNRSQETSTYLKYGGTWAVTSNINDSGGAAKYASVAGRYASFGRTLRDVAFVAPRSSTRGTAYVYLDGVKVGTITLRTSLTHYRQVLWSAHFNSTGFHTIKIVVVGTGRIDVDCFVVLN
jgi:hypothetical protein